MNTVLREKINKQKSPLLCFRKGGGCPFCLSLLVLGFLRHIFISCILDHIPQKAIEQIKEKNYQLRFQGKIGEIPVYEGSILAVGISYDKKTKKHSCEVEML